MTIEASVETFSVCLAPPPVPQVSTRSGNSFVSLTACARMTRAAAVISVTVSPFSRRPVRNRSISSSAATPVTMASMAPVISAAVSDWRFWSLTRAGCITPPPPLSIPNEVVGSSREVQKIPQDLFPALRKDGFRMKLHAVNRMPLVPEAHDLLLVRLGRDGELLREGPALDEQRVVACRRERVVDALKDALAVMKDERCLAVHEAFGAHDP